MKSQIFGMNKIEKKLLVFVFIITMPLMAKVNFIQTNYQVPQEEIIISTNYNTILTGETLNINLWIKNKKSGKPSLVSKVAYVDLIDHKGKIISQNKIAISNSSGSLKIFISENLTSGNYKLIAYTKSMLNGTNFKLLTKDLIVLNPFKKLPGNIQIKDSVHYNYSSGVSPNQKLKINTDKKNYKKREAVKLEIINPENLIVNNALINITRVDSLDFIDISEHSYPSFRLKNNYSIVPEVRGEAISGKLEYKEEIKNTSLSNKYVILSIPQNDYKLYLSQTNTKGEFNFTIPEDGYDNEIFLQVFGENKDKFNITLNNTQIDYSNLKFKDPIEVSRELIKNIEERSIALQIENAYYLNKKDSLKLERKKNAFYYPFEKVYVLENYTSFPTLEETIIEIIPEMYVSKKKNVRSIVLRDFKNDFNKEIYDKTLVLVDGLPLQNFETFFEYNPKNIDRVELVNRGYIIGSKIFNGVVNFITKNENYFEKVNDNYIHRFQIIRPQTPTESYKPNYDNNKLSRIPDYRNQLLWIENFKINSPSEEVSFFASDLAGKYKISIQGISEQGTPISHSAYFHIQ